MYSVEVAAVSGLLPTPRSIQNSRSVVERGDISAAFAVWGRESASSIAIPERVAPSTARTCFFMFASKLKLDVSAFVRRRLAEGMAPRQRRWFRNRGSMSVVRRNQGFVASLPTSGKEGSTATCLQLPCHARALRSWRSYSSRGPIRVPPAPPKRATMLHQALTGRVPGGARSRESGDGGSPRPRPGEDHPRAAARKRGRLGGRFFSPFFLPRE